MFRKLGVINTVLDVDEGDETTYICSFPGWIQPAVQYDALVPYFGDLEVVV